VFLVAPISRHGGEETCGLSHREVRRNIHPTQAQCALQLAEDTTSGVLSIATPIAGLVSMADVLHLHGACPRTYRKWWRPKIVAFGQVVGIPGADQCPDSD
jgi:hypothetical protein